MASFLKEKASHVQCWALSGVFVKKLENNVAISGNAAGCVDAQCAYPCPICINVPLVSMLDAAIDQNQAEYRNNSGAESYGIERPNTDIWRRQKLCSAA